ncbi:lipase 1 [Fusarium beomiforme]|uniref:Lipase 1 n=1 Tax=Fusarium beomiforme TaxID=44412 RepID=A0A9P5A9V4_9HYPO|nr:lipase 1 [Fusarium beomiforme]
MKFLDLLPLFAGLGLAANLDLWDVDDSCALHRDILNKAYNDAELMVVKSQEDLETLLDGRPQFSKQDASKVSNWDRIARAVTNTFGFVPDKGGHNPNEEHYSNVMYVFDRMEKTLHQGIMVPENGYGGLKPMIICDPDKFKWVGRDDTDPNDPGHRLLRESRANDIKDNAGAWVYNNRYIARQQKIPLGLCDVPGRYAVTMTRFDFIIFCPRSFEDDVTRTQSAVDGKDTVKVGDKLNSFGYTSLSRVMVHELAHWFGGAGRGLLTDRNVPDQKAVGKDGDIIYLDPATNKYTTDASTPNKKDVLTYDYLWVSYLARSHAGPNAGNTGPSKSTFTAEAYAIFAMMSYMDNFDWADDGKAKDLSKQVPYKDLPNEASDSSIITEKTPVQSPVAPSQDPWYSAPANWESKQPGDVLRIRSASILTSIVEGSAATYHILYRSTDSRGQPSWAVTTLFIPTSLYRSPSGKAAILSYQFAYNTCNVDSSPSFALSGVMAKSEPNLGIKASTFLISEMLSFGWIINTPDHLGPTAAFGASVQAGHATLDALRAVQNLFGLKESSGFNTAIWGYSGGSIATFAAAELQPGYAPNLDMSAVVIGGLVDDISADFDKINKSPIAGTLIAFLLGITAQYPDERTYLESRLVPENKEEFMSVLNTELTQTVAKYSGKDIYTFFKGGSDDLRAPNLKILYDKQAKLGFKGVPAIPMFIYKAVQDQFCPVELTDVTVDRLCGLGAEITFERNTVGSHVSEIENGKSRAFGFLRSIFDESYESPNPKRKILDVTVDVSSRSK